MKVTLINYTPDALETLLFTKSTRLKMSTTGIEEIKAWPAEKKQAELDYMLGTIQSSWEFVDYIFLIEGVTRAFTHQLVRHRAGTSFAQQAQRAVDMRDFEYITTGKLKDGPLGAIAYHRAMSDIKDAYDEMMEYGVPAQDARGVLPTNIATNICFKANLRTIHDMGLKRMCVKAQGEFQDVFRALKEEIVKVHPWAEQMIKVQCAWDGTCLFPSYPVEDCPVKKYVYDPKTGASYGGLTPASLPVIEQVWRDNRAEAQPGLPKEAK
jgi:flavin-dependent thymidylate synthase